MHLLHLHFALCICIAFVFEIKKSLFKAAFKR